MSACGPCMSKCGSLGVYLTWSREAESVGFGRTRCGRRLVYQADTAMVGVDGAEGSRGGMVGGLAVYIPHVTHGSRALSKLQ